MHCLSVIAHTLEGMRVNPETLQFQKPESRETVMRRNPGRGLSQVSTSQPLPEQRGPGQSHHWCFLGEDFQCLTVPPANCASLLTSAFGHVLSFLRASGIRMHSPRRACRRRHVSLALLLPDHFILWACVKQTLILLNLNIPKVVCYLLDSF